ncbi:MAG: hypothetical protein JXA09_17660 [Anaerolineae bacterium]|nr:hypothetical protein [Anaerolineae bacterium]
MRSPAYADYHVHSHLSPCAKPGATARAMLQRAVEKEIAAIGFADHFTPAAVAGCPFYDRQRLCIVHALRDEIAATAGDLEVDVLVGVEADYTLAGRDCLDAETLAAVDHVICASSHFHLPASPQPADDSPRGRAALIMRTAREALSVRGISVWAHPFDCSRMRPLVPILDTVDQDAFAALIALANANEVAIEVNGGPAQHPDYRQATAPFYALAREMGARFTVTADAHHPDHLDRLDLAWRWAEEIGIRPRDLLTADELRERQRRKR